MYTDNPQGLAFGGVSFNDEDRFNPLNLERDLQDIWTNDLEPHYFQYSQFCDDKIKPEGKSIRGYGQAAFIDHPSALDLSSGYFNPPKHFKENNNENEEYHFHFDNFSPRTPHQKFNSPIRRNEQGIMHIDNPLAYNYSKHDDVESLSCNKTTMYSHYVAPRGKSDGLVKIDDMGYSSNEQNELQDLVASKPISQQNNASEESSESDQDLKIVLTFDDVSNCSKDVECFSSDKVSVNEQFVSNEETDKLCKTFVKTPSSKPEDVDLAQRRDVVNKTVLRVVRRFYMQKFKEMFAHKYKTKDAKNKWYFEYIKKFTIELFGAAHPDLTLLQNFIASIINPKHMTAANIRETGLEKEVFFTYYNTLYKYSHTRLVNLFKVKPIGTLYNYFLEGPVEEMIKSEPAVCKNYSLYSTAFQDFWRVFNGYSEAFTLTLN